MTQETFHCADCGQDKLISFNGGAGYGICRDNPDHKICYDCCGKRDRADMIETGKATLYLLRDESGQHNVTNWPGTLRFNNVGIKTGRHNIAGKRYDVWFHGPDGKMWHGVQYGDNTQICHCRRTKQST